VKQVPKLERLLEVVGETAHPNFRCFISAEPPPIAAMKNMPESLMQGSIKVTRLEITNMRLSKIYTKHAYGTD
jgi:dynein heavy chain